MSLADDDERWSSLRSVDGLSYDPRAALRRLANGDASAWDELWGELHRQGRIGDAAYAALPEIVRVHEARGVPDFNTFAFAVMIDDARRGDDNPPLPEWLRRDYLLAWGKLELLALSEFPKAHGAELIHSLIATLAMAKQSPTLARIAMFAEEEREALLVEAGVR